MKVNVVVEPGSTVTGVVSVAVAVKGEVMLSLVAVPRVTGADPVFITVMLTFASLAPVLKATGCPVTVITGCAVPPANSVK